MSFDPKLGYLFVNTQDLGSIGKIVKNKEGSRTRLFTNQPARRGWPLLGCEERLALPAAAVGPIVRRECQHGGDRLAECAWCYG